ncbi:Formate/nitrite transporter-domain-containing protein [Xylariales sp. PMI_506]|nr:Formate/nitrite transporter-domain-containing protein [Xylariales sp. PMI_506]
MAVDVRVVNLASFTPAETIELVSRAGVVKANTRMDRVFLSAVSGGCMIGFASASYVCVTTAPWFQVNAPGVIEMVGAFIFPYGLLLVVLTGAELCTGSFLYTTVAVLTRRLGIWKMLMHWFVCFWGNLAGALLVATLICGYGGTFSIEPFKSQAISLVTAKQLDPTFTQILIRGIGCNWLVALSCFLNLQARDLPSKVIGIWWPVFAFVLMRFDNLVANMFFIPMGLWVGTPGLTVGLYIWKGIIPALVGNMIGGAVFVGGYYWWIYLAWEEDPVTIDGEAYRASNMGGVFGDHSGSGESGTDDNIASEKRVEVTELRNFTLKIPNLVKWPR